MSALFSLHDVSMRYNGTAVLRGVSLDFPSAQMVTIAGPNGAGKSTLLGIMVGLRGGYGGRCLYAGKEVRDWQRRAFAREVSFVPQSLRLEFPFTAEQVVLMGRTPHGDGLFETETDRAAVDEALNLADAAPFRRRDFRSLSGGERQRVVLASALAQKPRVLLLDEPTTFLDLKHQVAIYSLLRDLCRQGLLVVSVTHELNLAATFSDRVVLLHAGTVAADAPPSEAFASERIREVFEVEAQILQGPDGRPRVFYGV